MSTLLTLRTPSGIMDHQPLHPASLIDRRSPLVLVLLMLALSVGAQTTRFNVHKGNSIVGSVTAMRSEAAGRTIYVMTSHSEFDIIWKQVVRSSAMAEYVNGELATCHTSMRVNNSVRDSSHMARTQDQCFVHPRTPFTCVRKTEWTTSRMYYEEPVGEAFIFVESVLQDCPLTRTGPNTYALTLPNKHMNHYVYERGILQEIRIERSYVDLIFRRV